MEAIIFLSIIIALFSIFVSCLVIRRVKKQIAEITDALADVKNGNGNRRILSATNELVAPLAYEINEIVVSYEKRLSTVRQAEETNRQLMTSLSHDVRTPLTTLIGYLDAAHRGIVTGKDKDDYIETARRKAHDLKEYIDILFDWFKLNSNEFAMDINTVEAAELTRNILIDWISGTAKVFWISGADEAVTLLETTGTYSDTITLPDGGNYIGIECEDFTGKIEMNIK